MTSRFEVVRELGSGGQGRVLAVADAARGGQVVALKETAAKRAAELEREFVLLARLRHPNLVSVYEYFPRSPLCDAPASAAPPAAYTQEWVDGVDLFRALRHAPAEQRELVFEQVMRALAYLHALDVVHLDMKPENVLVRSAEAPVAQVLDFGIASEGGDSDEPVRGSYSYIAPERLDGGDYDRRADLYALGVMMAEVWIGSPPPPAELRSSLRDAAAREAWLRSAGVPESWLQVVTSLTVQDPAERPASVFEAATLWGLGLRRTLTLHTPGTVAAMLRAGPPAGRRRELTELGARLAAGMAVVVTGRQGSGRRTLARAAAREAQVKRHPVEWWPEVPGLRSVDGFAEALKRLLGCQRFVERLLAASPAPSAARVDPGGSPALGADPERFAAHVQAKATALAQDFVVTCPPLSDGQPRPLLFVQDLQHAPSIVRAFVRALVEHAERGQPLPLGLALTGEEYSGAAALPLAPLGRDAVIDFVKVRLGAATERLGAMLAAASGGHPLHLETLLALLVQRGDLSFGPDGWRWSGTVGGFELSAGMEEATGERVRLLDPIGREVLCALCWLRFPATPAEVAAVVQQAEDTAAVLAELEGAGLIWRDGEERFHAAHPSVARAAGDWLPRGGTQAAHRRVLERAEPRGLARAWHTGGPAGANVALGVAETAWEQARLADAAEALDLALAMAPLAPRLLELRARVANLLGPRELQVRCLEALLEVTPQDAPARLAAEVDLFWALTRIGDTVRAEEVGREVLELARRQGDDTVYTEALIHLANVVIQRGDYEEGARLLERALAQALEHDEPGTLARIYNNLGNVQSYRDDCEGALVFYEKAHQLKVAEGDPVGQRIALGNMGLMCLKLGRSAEAVSHFAASLEAARRTGHRRGEAWSLLALAVLALEAGALTYAGRRARAALEVAEELGDRLIACDAESTLAEVALAAGEADEARRLADSGLRRAEEVQSAYNAAGARVVLASAWLGEDPARAGELARQVWEAGAGDEVIRAAAARILAEAAVQRGDLDAAESAAREALRIGGRGLVPRVLVTVARVLRLVGSVGEADQVIEQARAEVARRAASWPERPLDDRVDEQALVDGPSRQTYLTLAEAALLQQLGEGGEMPSQQEGNEICWGGDGAAARWAAQAATASGSDLDGLIGAWLGAEVERLGAERGFLVQPDGEVLSSRDMDGEEVTGARRKVPEAAVAQGRAAHKVWRGSGGGGRGAVAALPVRAAAGEGAVAAVLVLQNRFVGNAFEEMEADPPRLPELGPLALMLRVRSLEEQLAQADQRLREAEERRRSEVTRSTEEILRLRRELETTREQAGPVNDYPEIVFASGKMRKMLRRLDRIVESELPVYVHGESGTGKELVARAVHQHGPRAGGPFVAQNCSAIPKTLFESEFFGHERGAFTGADRASEGLFRRSSGGTLFLDEIGDLPMDLQSKLLRVLETGEVRPVGGRRTHDVDVRIICATHRDLKELVEHSGFREDLYYRLNVVRIDVPPLRDRPEDIPVLVEHFLRTRGIKEAADLESGVMKALVGYDWPGNVRQLENEVTRAALLSDERITLEDLSDEIRAARGRSGKGDVGVDAAAMSRLGLGRGSLKERVDRLEAWALTEALERHGGNKSQVAREMGLSRAGLNMKLKRLGLWE